MRESYKTLCLVQENQKNINILICTKHFNADLSDEIFLLHLRVQVTPAERALITREFAMRLELSFAANMIW